MSARSDWAENQFMTEMTARVDTRVHRFPDLRDIRGAGFSKGNMPKQPADYLISDQISTYLAEVKYTERINGFSFQTGLEPKQKAYVHFYKETAQPENYKIYIYSNYLQQWFEVASANIPYDKDSVQKLGYLHFDTMIKMGLQWKTQYI